MGDIVIAAYRPRAGREADLTSLALRHVEDLRAWGLATDMPASIMRAKDGTVVEVFEWREGAIAMAHRDPRVLEMWGRYAEVCDYIPLRELSEASEMFATFAPLANGPNAAGDGMAGSGQAGGAATSPAT